MFRSRVLVWLFASCILAGSIDVVTADKAATELKSATDAIFATKAKDVVALGLFAEDGDAKSAFLVVAQSFAKVSSDAVAFYHSTTAEVLERYNVDTGGSLPAVLLFRGFDETGKAKRGKRVKFAKLDGDFAAADIARFIYTYSLPQVLSFPPIQGSPDEVSRTALADNGKLPGLYAFKEDWDEASVANLHTVAESKAGHMLVYKTKVDPYGEDDHEKYGRLAMLPIDEAHKKQLQDSLKDGDLVVATLDKNDYSGKGRDVKVNPDLETLMQMAEGITGTAYDAIKLEGGKKKKSKKGKKGKKGAKDDL